VAGEAKIAEEETTVQSRGGKGKVGSVSENLKTSIVMGVLQFYYTRPLA
jgi:hypothetical protein